MPDFLVEQLGIGLLIGIGRRAVIQPRMQDIIAEHRRVDPACLPVTIRHQDGWCGRYSELTRDQEVVVGEAHRRGSHLTNELAVSVIIPSQNQVEDVAADICWHGDMLPETMLSEHVGCAVIELSGDRAWHVEIADDRELAAEQSAGRTGLTARRGMTT